MMVAASRIVMEPTVSLLPFMSQVLLLPRTRGTSGRTLLVPLLSIPWLMEVVPVQESLPEPRTSVPAPVLVKPDVPPIIFSLMVRVSSLKATLTTNSLVVVMLVPLLPPWMTLLP